MAEYSRYRVSGLYLVSGFGLIDLCLAIHGIYGVLTYLAG